MKLKKTLLIIFILFILVFAACTFNEPVLPGWETIWELPLPEISYRMSEAIDNEFIFADTTQQGIPILSLSIADSIEKEGIMIENLSIKPDAETLSTTIEGIEISSPGKESTDLVPIEELLGFPIQPGNDINIPPNTLISLPPQTVIFSNFYYVMVNSGKLVLEFHNQTLLDISSGMQVELYDDSTNQFIGTSTFPQINAYSSEVADDSIDIGNKLVSRRLRLETDVPLEAGNYPVTAADTNGYIQTEVYISNLIVEEAIANIPQQTVTEDGAKSVENRDNHVIEAIIEEGQINLEIENQLEVEANVIITLPNFEEQNGQTFSQSELIEASTTIQSSIDLDGLRMYNFQSPGMTVDSVHYQVTVQTSPSSGLTHISNHDSVIVYFDSDSIYFSEFEGEIDTVSVEIDTIKQEDIFDYKDFQGSISLDELKLDLNIFNEIGIPVDIILNIRGEHRNNNTGNVENYLEIDPVYLTVNPGESGMPSDNHLELNSSNSKIVELMQILPTDIIMNGTAEIKGEGKVTLEDSIWGEYKISSPFNVFVDSIPAYESDIDTLDDLDEELKDAIENSFQQANLELQYDNGLPISANLILFFAKDTTDFFEIDTSDTNKLIIDDLKIDPGNLGPNNYVTQQSSGVITPSFNEKDLKIFASEKLYFGSKIFFPDVNTRMKFRSTDEFIGVGTFKFKVFMNTKNK